MLKTSRSTHQKEDAKCGQMLWNAANAKQFDNITSKMWTVQANKVEHLVILITLKGCGNCDSWQSHYITVTFICSIYNWNIFRVLSIYDYIYIHICLYKKPQLNWTNRSGFNISRNCGKSAQTSGKRMQLADQLLQCIYKYKHAHVGIYHVNDHTLPFMHTNLHDYLIPYVIAYCARGRMRNIEWKLA